MGEKTPLIQRPQLSAPAAIAVIACVYGLARYTKGDSAVFATLLMWSVYALLSARRLHVLQGQGENLPSMRHCN
jgi:hypothetical protein